MGEIVGQARGAQRDALVSYAGGPGSFR